MDGAMSKPPCNRFPPKPHNHKRLPHHCTTPAAALQGTESGERKRDPGESRVRLTRVRGRGEGMDTYRQL